MKKILFIIIPVCVLFSACTDFVDQAPVYKVQTDMQCYVDKFFYEAKIRGIKLPKENLIVSTSNTTKGNALLPSDAAGYFIEIGGQRYVTLWDGAFYYFINSDKKPLEAERLVFHELGHAFGRSHNNNPNSIMCQCMPSDYYVENDSLRTTAINELMKGLIY